MKKFINYLAVVAVMTICLLSGAAFGQSDNNVKTVGIDPSKNTVQLSNSPTNPLSVKVENTTAKRAFQARIIVSPTGTGVSTGLLAIPAGKRLVIENVSVIGRLPDGFRAEVSFNTYMDNDGDGKGGIEDLTFHRIPMIEQGVFDGTAISAANVKTTVFADSQIGNAAYGVTVQARLNGTPPTNAFTQVQFTISGYLEDLPAAN